MPNGTSNPGLAWRVLLVEDNEVTCRQIEEFFAGVQFDLRELAFERITTWEPAFTLIQERKVDLVILDIYRGEPTPGGERIGEEVLKRIMESGFVPVVIYTNLPEGLETLTNQFVRLVSKTDGGLSQLKEQIEDLFRMRIPQMHRAVINHLDSTLRDYMWKFVQPHWEQFGAIADKPEFLRLILQRLALTFAREGVEKLTAEGFQGHAASGSTDPEKVHPCEYYIKPPLGSGPLLGDIRVRETGDNREYLIVLWPSCDMVASGDRRPKTDRVLCAKATLLEHTSEMAQWRTSPSSNKEEAVTRIIKNTRTLPAGAGSADRYHYLPGAWEIPHLVVDFQALEHVEIATVKELRCLATLASPFAEALATRFGRYLGRPGTPDLDVEMIIQSLRQTPGS